MTTTMKTDEDQTHTSERIINLTLEIIHLLTGMNFAPVKSGDEVTITVPPPHCLTPEGNNKQKIVEISNKILELLTGEVPIRCQDVTVYFSMEEWEYLEGHKELYKDVMMENQKILIMPDECDVRDVSGKHSISSADYNVIDMKIIERSPEANTHDRFVCADPFSTDELPSSTPSIHPDGSADALHSENPFDKLQAFTLSLLPTVPIAGKTPASSPFKEPFDVRANVAIRKAETFFGNKCLTSTSKTNAAERPFSCSECGKCFNTKSHLVFHKKIHSGVRPYLCSECGKRFICKSHLTRHVSQHTGVRPYSCPECGKCFIGKGDLVSHLRYHTGERPYVCTECSQSFMQRGHLRRHLRIHTGERPFSCSECGKCFSWKDTLIKHQRTHMNEKMYTCRTCGKSFERRGLLIIHQRSHTGKHPKPSECEKSKKLQEHRRVGAAEVTLSCSESEELFIKTLDLVKYEETPSTEESSEQENRFLPKEVKVETEEKPFACSQCGKCYSQKRQLLTHQRTHCGDLPFSCSECGKGFTWKESLIRHRKFHGVVRLYSCADCGKSFTLKGDLLRHQRTHTDKLLHSCSECGKSFRLKKYLLKHQKSHSGERPFSCSDCGKHFTRRDSLYRHMRNHYGKP